MLWGLKSRHCLILKGQKLNRLGTTALERNLSSYNTNLAWNKFSSKCNEGQRRYRAGEGCTSFSLPEVKEGERTLRILLHWSSSAMDTASYSCPFRRKFCNRVRKHLMMRVQLKSGYHKEWLNVLYGKCTYSAIGEERVTLLYQNCFYHGRLCDTQHGLTAIKNAKYDENRTGYQQKNNTRWEFYAVTFTFTHVKQVYREVQQRGFL